MFADYMDSEGREEELTQSLLHRSLPVMGDISVKVGGCSVSGAAHRNNDTAAAASHYFVKERSSIIIIIIIIIIISVMLSSATVRRNRLINNLDFLVIILTFHNNIKIS